MSRLVSKEQLIVPAQINYLPVLRNFISRIASKNKFSQSEVNALIISVDEACTNIIKHGYRDIQSGSITVNVNVKIDRFEVELIDHGISFDPNKVSDPNLAQYIQNGKKGGLGIFIMKKFLDDIQYITSGKANVLRLIKFRKDGFIYLIFYPISSTFKKLRKLIFTTRHSLIHNNGEA